MINIFLYCYVNYCIFYMAHTNISVCLATMSLTAVNSYLSVLATSCTSSKQSLEPVFYGMCVSNLFSLRLLISDAVWLHVTGIRCVQFACTFESGHSWCHLCLSDFSHFFVLKVSRFDFFLQCSTFVNLPSLVSCHFFHFKIFEMCACAWPHV